MVATVIAAVGADGAADSAPIHLVGLTQITNARILMERPLSALCRSLTPKEQREQKRETPHADSWAHLYANQVALDYRRQNPNGHDYPVGSVFLKEKFSSEKDGSPKLATVMTKQSARGKVSDWEFSTIELPAGTRTVATAGGKCAACHSDEKATGYVSRITNRVLLEYVAEESKLSAVAPPATQR